MTPDVAHEKVELKFASEQDAVDEYMNTFGPFVAARIMLESQGRWHRPAENGGFWLCIQTAEVFRCASRPAAIGAA